MYLMSKNRVCLVFRVILLKFRHCYSVITCYFLRIIPYVFVYRPGQLVAIIGPVGSGKVGTSTNTRKYMLHCVYKMHKIIIKIAKSTKINSRIKN
jgi:hypothetical protein